MPGSHLKAHAPGGWMPRVGHTHGVPPGLEYLTQIDQLVISQKIELLEAFTTFETNNKYVIKNSVGQQVYYAIEDTSCLTRCCCGEDRPFDIGIIDNAQNEVLHISRPLRCSIFCCPCCLQILTVEAPPGAVIGYVAQRCSCCFPHFDIMNADEEVVLKIKGPFCQCSFCGDVEFQVYDRTGTITVGRISKQWSGILKEALTDTDNFAVTFPMDLDVKIKGVMLGAMFLIDFMFFETGVNERQF